MYLKTITSWATQYYRIKPFQGLTICNTTTTAIVVTAFKYLKTRGRCSHSILLPVGHAVFWTQNTTVPEKVSVECTHWRPLTRWRKWRFTDERVSFERFRRRICNGRKYRKTVNNVNGVTYLCIGVRSLWSARPWTPINELIFSIRQDSAVCELIFVISFLGFRQSLVALSKRPNLDCISIFCVLRAFSV